MSIPCKVYIRRNADGVIRCYEDLDWHEDSDYPAFIWEEGNFACDCNRYLFFCRAANEPETEYDESDENSEHRCGDDRYSVRITDVNGKELYSDFDE